MSAPSPPHRYPFNRAPFAQREPEEAAEAPTPRPAPDALIFYRDHLTGLRLCQTVQDPPLPPPRRPAQTGVLHVQPVALAPLPSTPLPSTPLPSAPLPLPLPPRPLSAALQELDRLFSVTAASLQPSPPRARPLYRPSSASPARGGAASPPPASSDLTPLQPDQREPLAPLPVASPGSRLVGLIQDTREQIAQLKAVLAASRAHTI